MSTPIKDRQTEIDENLAFFLQEMPKVSSGHFGKFALLRNKAISGYYDTMVDAVGAGNQLFPDKFFSVQQVTEAPVNLGYFS
jgi:hypothetical protein